MSGMSLWVLRIFKARGVEEWTNRYIVNAANLAAASNLAVNIANIERAVTQNDVSFLKAEVEPALLPAGGGTVVTLGGTGTPNFASERLPLFCTVRVNFRPASGKPSMKFLRGGLTEAEQVAGALTAGTVTFYQTNYVTPLLAIPEFVDPQGQPFVGSLVWPYVQDRQLGWKRRARPGQRRGWVPA